MPKSTVRKPEANSSLKKGKRSVVISAVQLSEPAAVLPNGSATELSEKIKDLVRLAQEQGQLTFNDISEALPENVATPEKLDEIYSKLRALEIEIVDQAEVDNVKKSETDEEDTTRLDILDDPVRMYLN